MPVAGRSIQFNIGSVLSLQLRTGFIAACHSHKSDPASQVERRQERASGELRWNGSAPEQRKESPFYEVVGPYADVVSSSQQETTVAVMSVLPVHVGGKATARASSSHYDTIKAYSSAANMNQEPISGQIGYMHSYKQNGQRVFMTTEIPVIDFFM